MTDSPWCSSRAEGELKHHRHRKTRPVPTQSRDAFVTSRPHQRVPPVPATLTIRPESIRQSCPNERHRKRRPGSKARSQPFTILLSQQSYCCGAAAGAASDLVFLVFVLCFFFVLVVVVVPLALSVVAVVDDEELES